MNLLKTYKLSLEEFWNIYESAENDNREYVGGEVSEAVCHHCPVVEVMRPTDSVIS